MRLLLLNLLLAVGLLAQATGNQFTVFVVNDLHCDGVDGDADCDTTATWITSNWSAWNAKALLLTGDYSDAANYAHFVDHFLTPIRNAGITVVLAPPGNHDIGSPVFSVFDSTFSPAGSPIFPWSSCYSVESGTDLTCAKPHNQYLKWEVTAGGSTYRFGAIGTSYLQDMGTKTTTVRDWANSVMSTADHNRQFFFIQHMLLKNGTPAYLCNSDATCGGIPADVGGYYYNTAAQIATDFLYPSTKILWAEHGHDWTPSMHLAYTAADAHTIHVFGRDGNSGGGGFMAVWRLKFDPDASNIVVDNIFPAYGNQVGDGGYIPISGSQTWAWTPHPDTTFTATVRAVEPTQAILTYTAPDTNACTIQVSETNDFGAGYAPVNDVKTSLFAGSNLDSRTGNITSGTARTFVIGTRKAQASGGVFYSRALRANTTHYYKITCGGDTAAGNFTTANIPLGATYADPLPADPATPGAYAYPTMDWSTRGQEAIDPQTGVAMANITRPGDFDSGTYNPNYVLWPTEAGSTSICAATAVSTYDSKSGYHCVFPYTLNGSSGLNALYWVQKAGVSSRFLGKFYTPYLSYGGGVVREATSCRFNAFSKTDPNVFYCLPNVTPSNTPMLVKGHYDGHANNTDGDRHGISFDAALDATWTDLTSVARNLDVLACEYEPNFCGFPAKLALQGTQNDKIILAAFGGTSPYTQDSFAWTFIFDPDKVDTANGCMGKTVPSAPGCIIAGTSSYAGGAGSKNRWCLNHTSNQFETMGAWVSTAVRNDVEGCAPGQCWGKGWYTVTITEVEGVPGASLPATGGSCPARPGGSPIPAGEWPSSNCNAITVSGEPTSPDGPNGGIIAAAVGDRVDFDTAAAGAQEAMRILIKTDATHWTVQRGYGTTTFYGSPAYYSRVHNPPIVPYMTCSALDISAGAGGGQLWWKYDTDPHGNAVGFDPFILIDHFAMATNAFRTLSVGANWEVRVGQPTAPASYSITGFPYFAGLRLFSSNNLMDSHPSYPVLPETDSVASWFTDGRPYRGDSTMVTADRVTHVTGDLYKLSGLVDAASGANFVDGYKRIPIAASSGNHVVVDISRPGAVPGVWAGITGNAADNYKFCVALNAGECYSGSVAKEIYFNAPGIYGGSGLAYCELWANASQGTPQTWTPDICLSQMSSYFQSVTQTYALRTDATGYNGRGLSHALSKYKGQSIYWNSRPLPDGSAILTLLSTGPWTDSTHQIGLLKQPPLPTVDTKNRATFIPKTITDAAAVCFGYAENGAPGACYCTPRAEKCYAKSAAIYTQANPFYYESEWVAAGSPTCAGNCTLPLISGRVAHTVGTTNGVVASTEGTPAEFGGGARPSALAGSARAVGGRVQ